MTPQEFIHKWKRANLSERSAYQQHFLDLCELLNQPKPAAEDPEGAFYTFERGVHKTDGSRGWADVWLKGCFAWEYKKKHKDLDEAYKQLQLYREDLENPPLLIVCDLDRFEIHTNFTNTPKQVFRFSLLNLGDPGSLDLLRKAFTNPDALRPKQTTDEITQEIAEKFAEFADAMRARLRIVGQDSAPVRPNLVPAAVADTTGQERSPVLRDPAQRVAHFLMKLMFCMFAEDIGLLEGKLFERILNQSRRDPKGLSRRLNNLFEAMATGGEFGADVIRHFNGGLFADADVIDLTWDEIEALILVNAKDWSNVEPSIFGTLFERTLDPAKRSQIGAHYTSKEDILTLLEPVLMTPLRREWDAVKAKCEELWVKVQDANRRKDKAGGTRTRKALEKALRDFLHRLATVKILDPACGSGNFLYVAINLLLDLEKQVIAFANQYDFSWLPHVRPSQLLGIEINPFAQELAQVVIWIGYLQWMLQNGFIPDTDPVLEPFENIKNMDAILDLSDPEHPKEPEWPAAEFIVGNPPFLGSKLLRRNLGDKYVESVFKLYDGRVKRNADLCVYWFERGKEMLVRKHVTRIGLLATQGIRGKASRHTLELIKKSGDIFFAISDRPWILDGAMVHVSMIGFDDGTETDRQLDGKQVKEIHADLDSGADVTKARGLPENLGVAFQGITPMGPFDIESVVARQMLAAPLNPGGQPNSNVVRRWANGKDLIEGKTDEWIIDFGCGRPQQDAAQYQEPFEFVKSHVLPARAKGETEEAVATYWLHWRPRPDFRRAIDERKLDRFLVTPRVAKHRLFIWVGKDWLPSDATIAFAVGTDFDFGILQSRVHELWARRKGTQLREYESGFRYIHEECFETFPFPTATPDQQAAIAAAAKELDTLRTNWLNPPEWTKQEVLEFPGSTTGPWARYVHDADARGIGVVRYPRLVAKDEDCAKKLQKRTLTNLYNERPTWLDLAHKKLDAAVAAAYGWRADLADEEILARLLKLNLGRAGK